MRNLKPLYLLLILISAVVVELLMVSISHEPYKHGIEQLNLRRGALTTPLERCLLRRLSYLPALSPTALTANLQLLSDYLKLRDILTSLRPIKVKAEVMAYKMIAPNSYLLRGGARQGIEKLDPVVYREHLVGVVVRVGPDYSVMLTLTSPEPYVSVTTLNTANCELRGFGYVRGSGSGIRVENFQPPNALRDGVLVVTSGQGLFPPGLIIGEVRAGEVVTAKVPPNPEVRVCEKRLPLSALPNSLRSLLIP